MVAKGDSLNSKIHTLGGFSNLVVGRNSWWGLEGWVGFWIWVDGELLGGASIDPTILFGHHSKLMSAKCRHDVVRTLKDKSLQNESTAPHKLHTFLPE